MYQTTNRGTVSQCVPVYSRGIPGSVCKSNEGKRPVVKGLWMSFRAQEILPVYKIDWHLLFPTMFRHCNLVMKVFNL